MSIRSRIADARYASIARRHGMQNSLRALLEARSTGEISPSLAMAILEQESGNGANVFGHDNVVFPALWKGAAVTEDMQGVGPMQLTWWEFQDEADRLGGAWKAKYNIKVGMEILATLIKQYGVRKGLAVYNGGATNPNYTYADQVLGKRSKWHKRFS
jgi:soluble lytic murein transglycosylase-like protein